MTIRVGESWTASNGHRRWVSMPLHDVLLGYGVWLECECPHGMCPVYPHPVMREAAAACGWEPPEGVLPWQEEAT